MPYILAKFNPAKEELFELSVTPQKAKNYISEDLYGNFFDEKELTITREALDTQLQKKEYYLTCVFGETPSCNMGKIFYTTHPAKNFVFNEIRDFFHEDPKVDWKSLAAEDFFSNDPDSLTFSTIGTYFSLSCAIFHVTTID